jgi:AraC family transcriptional activator of pobA
MGSGDGSSSRSVANAGIPLFALYGEEHWLHELDGLHVERLGARSRLLHTLKIRPHRHADLHQLMWIDQGGGVLFLDGRREVLTAPRLLALPAGVVHGFEWNPEIDGHVLTAAARALREMAPVENREIFDAPFNLAPSDALAPEFRRAFAELSKEFIRHGAGRRAGLAAGVLQIISLIARDADFARRRFAPVSADTELVARFRELIDDTYVDHLNLDEYCGRLGVTPSRLNRACRTVAGMSPLGLVQDRLLLEAKRMLTFTGANISEIGFALGFGDPAYFSRFFSRHAGLSPQEFRAGLGPV